MNRAERGLADPRESVGQTTTESLIDRLRSGHVEIRKQAIERSVHSADDVIVDRLIQLVQEPDVGQESRDPAAERGDRI